jgi:hypothetical protein
MPRVALPRRSPRLLTGERLPQRFGDARMLAWEQGTRAVHRDCFQRDAVPSRDELPPRSVLRLAHADQTTSPVVDRRSPGRVNCTREVIEKAKEPL